MAKRRWYFPSKEADVIPWIKNFVAVLAANAVRWGIAEALVTALANLGMAFEDAYTRRMLPDAGKVSVEQKNLALEALKQGVKDMVNGHINHNPAVTIDDRLALGLLIYSTAKGPLPAPETTVVMRVVMSLVRQLTVHVTDSATPDSRAKPRGAVGIELACGVLPSPPANEKELTRFESTTRSPVVLNFREEDRGKTVYIVGRWTGRGQTAGPWSGIISAIIP